MKIWISALVGCLTLSSLSASALDCKKAMTPTEKAVCSNGELTKLDADLDKAYFAVRSNTSTKAKPQLLAQQRAWLAERDKTCATAEVACLRTQYRNRLDDLLALQATASSNSEALTDVTPVLVKGSWKATSIEDPAGKKPVDAQVLAKALQKAELPPVGGIVRASPGKLCVTATNCDDIGWMHPKLADTDGGPAVGRQLGLRQTDRVFVGSSGGTRSYYQLVPRPDGSLLAVFGVCGATEEECRNAGQVWAPASPDATFRPKP